MAYTDRKKARELIAPALLEEAVDLIASLIVVAILRDEKSNEEKEE